MPPNDLHAYILHHCAPSSHSYWDNLCELSRVY